MTYKKKYVSVLSDGSIVFTTPSKFKLSKSKKKLFQYDSLRQSFAKKTKKLKNQFSVSSNKYKYKYI